MFSISLNAFQLCGLGDTQEWELVTFFEMKNSEKNAKMVFPATHDRSCVLCLDRHSLGYSYDLKLSL